MLVHWGKWYKSIYEMLPGDKPEDKVIEDDVALDRWFESFMRDTAVRSAHLKRMSEQNMPQQAPAINIFGG